MAKEQPEAATQFITLTPEQLQQLIGSRSDSDEFLRKQALFQAEANKKVLRPENEQHPGISAYRPEGRRDDLQLKCKMFWVGYPLDAETLKVEEIDLFNKIEEPGDFTFHRTDGTQEKLTISGEKDTKGQWTKLLFNFPCQGDARHNLPPTVDILRAALGVPSEAELLRRELAALKAKVA